MEAHHSNRGRIRDGPSVTIIEKVPSFMTKKLVGLADDIFAFKVQWGLLRKDIVAGSSEAAAI